MPKFSIRFNPARSKKKPWQLDLGLVTLSSGRRKRVFEYFAEERMAEMEREIRLRMVKQHGVSALAFSIEEGKRWSAQAERLKQIGASIEEAVDLLMRQRGALKERITMGELVARGLAAEMGSRYMHASWLGFAQVNRAGQFLGERAELLVDQVMPEDVEAWLEDEDWSEKTRRNNLTSLSSLFRWAMHRKRGLASGNPCVEVELEDDDEEEGEVSCIGPEQAEALLVATRHYAPLLLWKPVLGLFGGVRAKELAGMEPKDISIEGSVVVVRAAVAKATRAGRQRRTIELSENAAAWLRVWERERGQALSAWHARRAWWAARRAAGWWLNPVRRMKAPDAAIAALMERPRQPEENAWPRNVLRHTFASMHYALHRNEEALRAQMGHEKKGDVLMRRYRAVHFLDGRIITPALAKAFWEICP